MLDLGRQRTAPLELGDQIERRAETGVRDQVIQAPLERGGIVLMFVVMDHELVGAGFTPAPLSFAPSRRLADAEADQNAEIETPAAR